MAIYTNNSIFNSNKIAIPVVRACETIYDNQATIDSLNGILANMESLRTNSTIDCNANFIRTVEMELLRQISIGRVLSKNCEPISYGNPVILRRY